MNKFNFIKISLVGMIMIQPFLSISQNNGYIHDSLDELKYLAYFADPQGNTTSEEIIFKPLCIKWSLDNSQFQCQVLYNPTDSIINLIDNPINPKTGIRTSSKTTTGYIDSKKVYWVHPFRSNQYVYTEIAPFPSIYYDKLIIGEQWEEKLRILFGWGKFKGKVKKTYEVIGTESFTLNGDVIENCWRIQSTAKHSKLGVSKLTYLFHENHGFLYMKYIIYNGVKIEFTLIDEVSKI